MCAKRLRPSGMEFPACFLICIRAFLTGLDQHSFCLSVRYRQMFPMAFQQAPAACGFRTGFPFFWNHPRQRLPDRPVQLKPSAVRSGCPSGPVRLSGKRFQRISRRNQRKIRGIHPLFRAASPECRRALRFQACQHASQFFPIRIHGSCFPFSPLTQR